MKLVGIAFDLDGTLVDSGLNFPQMRADIGIPAGQPILEYIEKHLAAKERERAQEILARHEMKGAREATLIDGASTLLETIKRLGLRQAIFTRNYEEPTHLVLQRLSLENFQPVITRECARPKPDPEGLLKIVEDWKCSTGQVIVIGDFRYDITAAHAAGMKAILYAPAELPPFAAEADEVWTSLGKTVQEFRGTLTRLGLSVENP